MATSEQHLMERVLAYETGAEEWACPTCGRRLLVHSDQTYATTLLAAGDGRAIHVGGAGASQPPATDRVGGGADEADGDEPSLEMLRPWLKALKAIEDEGFGSR